MAQHEERALVLDIVDYRESSSLVHVFAEFEGRISLVARGLKKPKSAIGAGTLQPFNLVRVRYFLKEGSTIGNLVGSDIERVNSAPRNSLEAYAMISYWFDILKQTSQAREAAPAIFNLTTSVLECQEEQPGLTLQYILQLTEFCRYLGFGISWNCCVICGKEFAMPSQFSITRGGIICDQCAFHDQLGLQLDAGEKMTIADLTTPGAAEATPAAMDLIGILGIINRYLTYHLEHPPRTFSFVRTTISS